MSCNRENVTWKTRDGTWSSGFFEYDQYGDDHEWDVEYDKSKFHWASTGHATQEEANNAWDGANPGGRWIITEPSAETDEYDRMVQELRTHEAERSRETYSSQRRWSPY